MASKSTRSLFKNEVDTDQDGRVPQALWGRVVDELAVRMSTSMLTGWHGTDISDRHRR